MKYKIERDEEPKEVNYITVFIGLDRYRLHETIDGRLQINKWSDGDSDYLRIHPRTGNEIELS